MLKFLGKTLFKYGIFLKYKSSIIKVVLGLLTIIIIHFVYADISESFKSTQSLECLSMSIEAQERSCIERMESYRLYVLIIKWVITLLAVVMIIVTLNPISAKKKSQKNKLEKSLKRKNKLKSQRTQAIDKVMNKGTLRSEADKIWDDLQK